MDTKQAIIEGKTTLGIEFGSTRLFEYRESHGWNRKGVVHAVA